MTLGLFQRTQCCYLRALYSVPRRWKSNRYSDTVLLPKTLFPLTMKGVSQREAQIQKTCEFNSLYEWQRQDECREKVFVLHDGPPYANGDLHVGHSLNKILKDMINRYKLLQGYKVHYVPGWDCHGMPIEQKALAELRTDHTEMSATDIRDTARRFAEKTVKKHRKQFEQWGVMADWKNGYYTTLQISYQVNQLEVFYQMYKKGYIYEDYMPVYWSPSSRSALAEAELEYKPDHKSTAVYAKFPLTKIPPGLQDHIGEKDNLYALIWTLTPWNLPLNQAICYGPTLQYSLVRKPFSQEVYIIGSEFVKDISGLLKEQVEVISSVSGSALEGGEYTHPTASIMAPSSASATASSLPLLPGLHVTKDKGTGLVHTSAAHGVPDFQMALKHSISLECHVDEAGRYKEPLPSSLVGKLVTKEGNQAAIDLFSELIIDQSAYTHSYPYDWRTKQPVILRASKQWFVNTANITDRANECLSDELERPSSLVPRMKKKLQERTYWCISRQRVWGVPIPTFYNTSTGEVLLSRASIDHLKQLFTSHGSDCWWTLPIEDLLPKHIIEQSGHDPSAEYARSADILDIWFDSGCSWATVLKDSGADQADLYLEGLDQLEGWFQSSLLTSVAVQDKAPYKSLLGHGFAVDEEGKKMSKSLGNVVDPNVVINGKKGKDGSPAYGVDVLRWWVARAGLEPVVNIGPTVLARLYEQVFKIRKSLRYLMANLHDFSIHEEAVAVDDMPLPDRHMLHQLYLLQQQVTEAYEAQQFFLGATLLELFITNQVSSRYGHITKHRMYCTYSESVERKSCQTVQYHVLHVLTKLLAPILPHLAEEVAQYPPLHTDDMPSIFKSSWPVALAAWHDPSTVVPMDICATVRNVLNTAVHPGHSINFDVVLCVGQTLLSHLKQLQADDTTSMDSSLAEVLQVPSVTLLSTPPLIIPEDSQLVEGFYTPVDKDGSEVLRKRFMLVVLPAENCLCPRCRRMTAPRENTPCDSCQSVLTDGWEGTA